MGYRINIDSAEILKKKLGIDEQGEVQKFFTHTCRMHMDKYVPFDNGNLALKVWEEPDKVIYLSKYAHYQYEGKTMGPNVPITRNGIVVGYFSPIKPKHYTGKDLEYKKDKHSLAGPFWDKRMWSAEKDTIIKEVANYMKMRGINGD